MFVETGIRRILPRYNGVTLARWELNEADHSWYRAFLKENREALLGKKRYQQTNEQAKPSRSAAHWKEELRPLLAGSSAIVYSGKGIYKDFRSAVTGYCSNLWGSQDDSSRRYATRLRDDGGVEVYRFQEG
jgi:hypothetical protein